MTDQPLGTVLVVDDDPVNRQLMRELLAAEGYRIAEAGDGDAALAHIQATPPDVVLLDVMMPGKDGFEVCRLLKEAPRTATLPILIITALGDRQSRLKGIDAGADDYLTKPIDINEVNLRLRNALRTKRLNDRLRSQYQQLQKLESLRDSLTHMIVHDLRTTIQGMTLNLELAAKQWSKELGDAKSEYLQRSLKSAASLKQMTSVMLDINRLEAGEMPLNQSACDIVELCREAAHLAGLPAADSRINFPGDLPSVVCDADLIRRVMLNLISNALVHSPAMDSIRISIAVGEDHLNISVSDQGPGIAAAYHKRIFDKFGQAAQPGIGHKPTSGLGLAFCKLAVEAHAGNIGVSSQVGKGATFWFTLPLKTLPGGVLPRPAVAAP